MAMTHIIDTAAARAFLGLAFFFIMLTIPLVILEMRHEAALRKTKRWNEALAKMDRSIFKKTQAVTDFPVRITKLGDRRRRTRFHSGMLVPEMGLLSEPDEHVEVD